MFGRLVLWLLPLLLLGGCAVSFVSPYDAMTDAAIQEAAVKAETIFAKVAVNKAGHASTAGDYRELDGMLAVLAMRAEVKGEKNATEQGRVASLRREMAALEKTHVETGPYRVSATSNARRVLRALIHHQESKQAASAAGGTGGAE